MNRLGVFAKYWQPGAVKTRLASAIGGLHASQLYLLFLDTLLRRFDSVADQRVLCYWPEERREDFRAICGSAWQLVVQSDGDLGQRMNHFFGQSLSDGYGPIVLIGSDSPTLPADYLQRAFDLLESHSAVLGPTDDGGYYLVGVAGALPPIFQGVAWSTPTVWQQTVGMLRAAKVPFAELPPWYDVDQVDDLSRLRDELAGLSRESTEWRRLLWAVEEALAQ